MFPKYRAWVIFLISVLLITVSGGTAAAKGASTLGQREISNQCLNENSNVVFNQQSGLVRFVGTSVHTPITKIPAVRATDSPEQAGRGYLSVCGSLFGLTDQSRELQMKRQSQTEDGRHVLHFQQTYQGVPVFAGELNMQLTANQDVLMVNGEILPDIKVDTSPGITANAAQQVARNVIVKEYQLYTSHNLIVSKAKLWIHNPGLIGDPLGPSLLTWRMEVTHASAPFIRHLVFVDAKSGSIILNLNLMPTAKNLKTYDMNNGTNFSTATLVCDNSDPNCTAGGADIDAINAHVYAGDAYDFYMNHHGRDSINNAGMTIKSYVHYDNGWCNARWTGSKILYGDGCSSSVVADDVVAHEYTHGVTDYESDLVYKNQSGAINESFSDIWGELVDLTNGKGTDTAEVRWQIGEDAHQVLRDMEDPPSYGDPDKMSSEDYYKGDDDDTYVHTNSGVGNKAAYLITDGGTFNDYVITGIGIDKAAKIYYEVQSNILTSGAEYDDLGNALIQACKNLVGTNGITSEDCTQVSNATYATEILIPVPTPETPSNNLRDRTPEFTWTKEIHATEYRFQVKDGLFTLYTKTVDTAACSDTTCSNTPADILGYKNYKWRVRSRVGGVWGPWSAYMNFKVLSIDLFDPSGSIIDRTPEYVWTEEVGATSYEVQLKNGLRTVYTETVDASVCVSSFCYHTPAQELDYKSYTWRVRAKTGEVWGAWSPSKNFRVISEGFNSTFDTDREGWRIVNGNWTIDSAAYLKTPGVSDRFGSTYYDINYSKLDYQVDMFRTGTCTGCANALYVRGKPTPTWTSSIMWEKGYYFAYTNSGYYSVWLINNPSITPLKIWTATSAINNGGWNTLRVIAQGRSLKFYINNILVWSGNNSALSSGKVGITMYRASNTSGNALYVDWATLDAVNFFNLNLMDEQVDVGQVELEGGEEMGPAFVVPNAP